MTTLGLFITFRAMSTQAEAMWDPPQWTLADRLVKARTQAGFSQKEMAEHLGVAQATISKFERGHHVRAAYLYVWAQKCNVPFDWLRGEDVNPFSEQPRRRSGWFAETAGTTAA